MRTGSPDLTDALDRGQRTYDLQVRLGGRDVTDEVTAWSVERGSDTSLPEQVAAPTGSAAASASVSLTGAGTQTAAARYSPWAPRSTADITRPGQSAVISWGLAEARLQALRGRVRSVRAHSRSGAADVTVLDGAELMRGKAWLPPAATATSVQSHVQWVLDHALRECGIYASPPARPGAIFFASMNCGREANVGMRLPNYLSFGTTGYYPDYSPWTAGPKGIWSPNLEWTSTYVPQKRILSQQNTIMVEWWVRRSGSTGNNPRSEVTLLFADRPQNDSGTRTETDITVSYDTETGQIRARVRNGSATWTAPNSSATGNYKVAFMIGMTTTSSPVTVRGWLYRPDGTLYATPTYNGTTPTWGMLDTITVTATGPIECVGVTPVTGNVDVVRTWRRGARLALVRGHVGSSGGSMKVDALPEPGGTWWDLVKQIASDTMSFVWFDEDGVLNVQGGYFSSPDETPPEPDLTVTAERSISDIEVVEEIDSIRNLVSVSHQEHRLGLWSNATNILEYSGTIPVAGGETVEVAVDTQDRPYLMAAPMVFSGSTPPSVAVSYGTSLIKFVTSTGSRAPVEAELVYNRGHPLFRFHNRGANPARAVLSSTDSTPSFRMVYRDVTEETPLPVTRQVPASVARYGSQSLEVGASPWVQDADYADTLTRRILSWTAWPMPMTGRVEILPDPRIQIGDAVQIVDREGVRIDGIYRVLGYTVSGAGTAVTMSLDVRPVTRPAQPSDAGLTTEPILDPDVEPALPG